MYEGGQVGLITDATWKVLILSTHLSEKVYGTPIFKVGRGENAITNVVIGDENFLTMPTFMPLHQEWMILS